MVFAFDLDGTVTRREILPVLANELGLKDEMALLTRLTLDGTLDFAASFRLRFAILRSIPVERVREIVSQIPLDPHISGFINKRKYNCAIVTGNLDVWVEPLLRQFDCPAYVSTSRFRDGLLRLDRVLDKGDAVRELKATGKRVIAIGESANDLPMFTEADTGVAFAGVHEPLPEIRRLAAYTARTGQELCEILERISDRATG